MAASSTVSRFSSALNSSTQPIVPSRGVVTLSGYGISIRVDRGHLVVEDGIGAARRRARFARVGHALRRMVVIGNDGSVSLAALRWLADQDAAFIMLDRDGGVLLATGPIGPKDARIRRAQATAHHTGLAIPIARELIARKLIEQARVVADHCGDRAVVETIESVILALEFADTIKALRQLEAQAASVYWQSLRSIRIEFPRKDLARVPEHWRVFGTRQSPLTNSPRLAVNPPNAMLNYLYALLESEARLASVALGLDPGLAFAHADTDSRDSLACDLMEPVRPQVDAYVLNWLKRAPLRREWFFEQRDGTCRLMGSLAMQLSETTTTWARAVAPVAEWVARAIASSLPQSRRKEPPTHLTQQRRREAKGGAPAPDAPPSPKPICVCRLCGKPARRSYCAECGQVASTERLVAVAHLGVIARRSPEVLTRQSATRRRHARAEATWKPSDQPEWLTARVYREQIQPGLVNVSARRLAATLGVSRRYAISLRAGRYRPHPRHWSTLAALVGVFEN
jgi:CRISPR-associated endonuclease Cas1